MLFLGLYSVIMTSTHTVSRVLLWYMFRTLYSITGWTTRVTGWTTWKLKASTSSKSSTSST